MSQQASLFDRPVNTTPMRPVVAVQHREGETLDDRFAAWLAANPQVLSAFIALARQAQRAGLRKFGAKAVVERLRWEYAIQTGGSEFKFDNRFTSRLARVAVDRAPDLAGLFEFRDLRS